MRLYSILPRTPYPQTVKHYFGQPPRLTDGIDRRRDMGPARLLLLEQRREGFFIFRYDANGSFAGDTWHQNLEDAKHQAEFEYEGFLQPWQEVPEEVKDAVAFGLERASASSA